MSRKSNQRLSDRVCSQAMVDEWVQSSCAGKEAFDTPQMASKVCRRRNIPSEHYRCLICGKFHIGIDFRSRAAKRARKRARQTREL